MGWERGAVSSLPASPPLSPLTARTPGKGLLRGGQVVAEFLAARAGLGETHLDGLVLFDPRIPALEAGLEAASLGSTVLSL